MTVSNELSVDGQQQLRPIFTSSSSTPSHSIGLRSRTVSRSTFDTTGVAMSAESIASVPVAALFVCLYAVVFILGLFGNSLVVYVVARNRSMQTATNLFIGNLAAADVMICLLAVPFTPLSGLLRSWPFGEALCHLVPMTLGVSVYVSTLTSTAIAVNRYFVIIRPFQQRPSTTVCMLLVAAIWVISVTVSLPLAINQKVTLVPSEEDVYTCREHWPSPVASQFFTISSLILQYLIPGSIITYCYIKVSLALQSRERAKMAAFQLAAPLTQTTEAGQLSTAGASINGDGDATAAATQNHRAIVSAMAAAKTRRRLERKRRTNRMLIAMVLIFVVCWLPLNVIHVTFETIQRSAVDVPETSFYENVGPMEGMSTEYLDYGTGPAQRQQSGTYLVVFFVVHLIAMSSAVYNPFLYAWMNENFKGHFARVFPFLFRPTYFYCTFTRRVDGDSADGSPPGRCCCTISRKPPAAGRRRPGGNGCCGAQTGDDAGLGDVSTGWSPSKYTTVRNDNGCAMVEMVSTPMASGGLGNHVHEDDDDDDDDDVDEDEETQTNDDHWRTTRSGSELGFQTTSEIGVAGIK